MPAEPTSIKGRVLLVSAPWPLFNRPSLPLGALKAYLSKAVPQVQTEACHLFLQMGISQFDRDRLADEQLAYQHYPYFVHIDPEN